MREITGFDLQAFSIEANAHPTTGLIKLVAGLSKGIGVEVPEKALTAVRHLSLGQWEATLLSLRRISIGDSISAVCQCSECGEDISLIFNLSQLPIDQSYEQSSTVMLSDKREVVFHPLTPGDLEMLELADLNDENDCLAMLLENATNNPGGWGYEMLSSNERDILLAALDASIRALDLTIGTHCANCSAHIETRFDVADFLTLELQRYAEQLLDDVHKIALTYHWSESEILSLSISRRNAYLQRIDTDAAMVVIERSIA